MSNLIFTTWFFEDSFNQRGWYRRRHCRQYWCLTEHKELEGSDSQWPGSRWVSSFCIKPFAQASRVAMKIIHTVWEGGDITALPAQFFATAYVTYHVFQSFDHILSMSLTLCPSPLPQPLYVSYTVSQSFATSSLCHLHCVPVLCHNLSMSLISCPSPLPQPLYVTYIVSQFASISAFHIFTAADIASSCLSCCWSCRFLCLASFCSEIHTQHINFRSIQNSNFSWQGLLWPRLTRSLFAKLLHSLEPILSVNLFWSPGTFYRCGPSHIALLMWPIP